MVLVTAKSRKDFDFVNLGNVGENGTMAIKNTRGNRTKANKQTAANEAIVSSVQNNNLDNVLGSLASAQADVQRQLSELSAAMADRYGQLEAADQAIQLKKEELERLHAIEINLNTLDSLKDEIVTTRANWDKEVEATENAWKEKQDERNKVWKRCEEEYNYKTKIDRTRAEEAFRDSMAKQEREAAERQELMNKAFEARDEALQAREDELLHLKQTCDGIPELVRKERAAEAAIVSNTLKREFEHQSALLKKDMETNAKIFAQTEAALESRIAALVDQNARLNEALTRALTDQKEIARAAVDANSGRQALDALQRNQDHAAQPLGKQQR